MTTYIETILPLPLGGTFTYILPEEMAGEVKVGMRIIVPFGRSKFYTALVYGVRFTPPENVELKEVIGVLDASPIVRPQQIKFWEWIASYYQCTLGEVFKAAVPSGLKLESETTISLVEDFEAEAPLKEREQLLLDCLSAKEHTVAELNKLMGMKNVLPLVKRMMDMGAVSVSEELKAKYKPKMETYVRLSPEYMEEAKLSALFDALERAKKQSELLMIYIQLSCFMQPQRRKEVSRKALLDAKVSPAALTAMVEKGIFELYKKDVDRIEEAPYESALTHPLSDVQQRAYGEIRDSFTSKDVVLLHGVTSSGKTEIYIHLIEETLKLGRQVLFLLPEIALTTQITNRLRRVFGNQLGVYHSKFTDNERVEIWKNLLEDKSYKVILGVRSSVFLPFKNLGLVIVDEEHENTYKQFDPAPRYHARNAAIVLAKMSEAKVLLGSATPSLESYECARSGKFGLVELMTRYEGIELPDVMVADVKEARRKKEMVRGVFSPMLIEQVRKALDRKEQVILFQNRRGFSPFMMCRTCGCVPRCQNCDISLTYHKSTHQLVCHYCGYTMNVPTLCPACETPELEPRGFGTEKIEEEIAEIFPGVRVVRLDLDVAKSRKNYEKIIHDFEEGAIDILVGTQIISKGLDFERVRVVGILDADSLLNYPDFRAFERAYQMMAQVSGRAGRKNNRGIVVIQTSEPDHPVIRQVRNNDYTSMFNVQMNDRAAFKYPPYYRLIYIYIKGKEYAPVNSAANYLATLMRQSFGDRVYGPDKPVVARIQNLYILKVMLKVELKASVEKAKAMLRELTNLTLAHPAHKSVYIQVDVDPM